MAEPLALHVAAAHRCKLSLQRSSRCRHFSTLRVTVPAARWQPCCSSSTAPPTARLSAPWHPAREPPCRSAAPVKPHSIAQHRLTPSMFYIPFEPRLAPLGWVLGHWHHRSAWGTQDTPCRTVMPPTPIDDDGWSCNVVANGCMTRKHTLSASANWPLSTVLKRSTPRPLAGCYCGIRHPEHTESATAR